MVVIPAGTFQMGCLNDDGDCADNEKPVHEVRIGRPFALGVREVTREEFGRFVDATGRSMGNSCYVVEDDGDWVIQSGRGWRSPGFRQSGSHPVVCASWDDAKAYAAWLSRETGEMYRLPSESEWEYAARAGTATKYHFGSDSSRLCRWGNGADLTAKEEYSDWMIANCRDGHVHTAPTGSFEANGFGLHDMHGNVWEWVEDCWNASYVGRAFGRRRVAQRRLREARFARRLLAQLSEVPPCRVPAQGRHHRRPRVTTSGSVWPGRSPLESLRPYLFWGFQGGLPPWSVVATSRSHGVLALGGVVAARDRPDRGSATSRD